MFKKLFKTLLPTAFLGLGFLGLSPQAHAADYADHQLTLIPQGDQVISPLLKEKEAFNSVALQTEADLHEIYYRLDANSPWEEAEMHDDYGYGPEALIFMEPTQTIQFMVRGQSTSLDLSATVFYVRENEFGVGGPVDGTVTVGVKVISRLEWGADESMRVKKNSSTGGDGGGNVCKELEQNYGNEYKVIATEQFNANGEELIWPIQKTNSVEMFAVHHTDSEIKDVNGDGVINKRDYEAIVRAIYRYHTITRGWGDIGYNYLIDPLGNIYEGRAGGDTSIGAHSLCFNPETIGIAIIGNYENQPISPAAFDALVQLIGQKSKQYGIDPAASSEFRGKFLNNVYGHKDVRSTSCPGTMLYSQLDEIRQRAALVKQGLSDAGFSPAELAYNAELVGGLSQLDLDPNETRTITLKFKNTGKETWTNETWLHVANNDAASARIVPIVANKNFVAANLKEATVPPGSVGTFEVTLEAGSKFGYYSLNVSVVANQKYKISRASEYIDFNVMDSNNDYEVVTLNLPSGEVYQGQILKPTIQLRNLGQTTWVNTGPTMIRIAADHPRGRNSSFVTANGTVVAKMVDAMVPPGQVGTFEFYLRAPQAIEGPMTEYFSPIIGSNWLPDKNMNFEVNVIKPLLLAETQRAESVPTLRPGESKEIQLTITNTGNVTWDPLNFKVTSLGKGIKTSEHFIGIDEEVPPGESITIKSTITATLQPGIHEVYWRARAGTVPIRGAYAKFVIIVDGEPVSGGSQPTPSLPMLPGTSQSPSPTPAPSNVQSNSDDLRVRLSHYAESATLTADTAFDVVDGSGSILFTQKAGDQIQVLKVGDNFSVTSGTVTKTAPIVRLVPKERSGVTEVVSWTRNPTWDPSKKYNDNRFRDTIEMRIINGKVYYINELPLEDYLRGLAELGNGAHRQKELVIAVLARSYAYHYLQDANRKFPGMPWDGSDDPNEFQKYLGYSYEVRSSSFVNAVESTHGEVVTYNGEPIKTPYFSRSDGVATKSSEEVWGWSAPYLVSVPDPWCESTEFAGHGVGLSGCGAEAQAQQGKNYKEIIKYYYNNVVEIEKVY